MAKARNLLLALICVCTGLRAGIIDTAQRYTYVREHGQNKGREIALFLKSVGINHPAPWCAAFANYVLQKANVPHKMSGRAISCCPVDANLIYSKGKTRLSKAPQPGDLFFWFRPGGGHTGFIKEWPASGDYFTTVEGNVTRPDGYQGVAVKTRKKAAVQKIYAASVLAGLDTTPVKTVDSTSVPNVISPKPQQNQQTKEAPPPYTPILILVILVALWQKGYFQF